MRIRHARYFTNGLILAALGINLAFSRYFYRWPPFVRHLFINDFLGVWAIVTAIGFFILCLKRELPVKTNLIFILSASGLLGMDSVIEIGHAIVFNDPVRTSLAILTVAFLFSIWDMAKDSDSAE